MGVSADFSASCLTQTLVVQMVVSRLRLQHYVRGDPSSSFLQMRSTPKVDGTVKFECFAACFIPSEDGDLS